MTGEQFEKCSAALERALANEYLLIERAQFQGANITHWSAVPPHAILGSLMQHGWRISLATQPMPLSMVQEDDDE